MKRYTRRARVYFWYMKIIRLLEDDNERHINNMVNDVKY